MKRCVIGMAAVVALAGYPTTSLASLVRMNLTPWSSESGRDDPLDVGAQGLWLGKDFDFHGDAVDDDTAWRSWRWDDTWLEIANDGDGSIRGTMTHLADGSTWGISVRLMDIQLRGELFDGAGGRAYGGMVEDLLASGDAAASIGWDRLSLQLFAPYRTAVPLTGWRGYDVPLRNHHDPASLRLAGGRLRFDARYQATTRRNRHYSVGVSSAGAGTDAVPEPGTALLLGLGLATLGARHLRRR